MTTTLKASNGHQHTCMTGRESLPVVEPGALLFWAGGPGTSPGFARVLRVERGHYVLKSDNREWHFPTAGLSNVDKAKSIHDGSQLFVARDYINRWSHEVSSSPYGGGQDASYWAEEAWKDCSV